jgi:hypothetical protein
MKFKKCGAFWAVYNDNGVLIRLTKYLSASDVDEMVKSDGQTEEPDDIPVQTQLFDTDMVT